MEGDSSSLSPLGLLFLLVMVVLTWRLPRRQAVIPLLITTCYMPLGQMLVIAGLHFPFLRIILLVGWARVLSRKENAGFVWSKLDKLFMWWAIVTLVFGTLSGPKDPSIERFINRAGTVYTAMGIYYLFRMWIREFDDVVQLGKFLAYMIVPLAVSMLIEKVTTRNIFSAFGGVPEVTLEREGKLRCQGAFLHPILAGTYGATLFPIFVGLWQLGRQYRRPAIIGGICACVVTVAAATSGALLAMMVGTAALFCWKIRLKMNLVRRGIVLSIIALALIMKAPVYYSLARLSEIAGGTGWYRSYLIDQSIQHFGEWWMFGSTYTAHWAPAGEVVPSDPDNMDIINHYVAEGLGGGVVKLGLFLALIVRCFKTIGRWTGHETAAPKADVFFLWSLGVILVSHCISFLSVSYFDQIVVMWYWLLASLSMVELIDLAPAPVMETTRPEYVESVPPLSESSARADAI